VTISELAPQIQSGKISPVELTSQTFALIRQRDPALNSYLTLMEAPALEQARQAEREIRTGHYRGPLHGIPYAVKDLFYTRGLATTAGSKILRSFVPEFDAAAIDRLREAGAVLVGKTGLHELAYGITNNNPHFGAVRNPWDPERIPGGSSGGSAAALAAGLCVFSLGSDTGGSVRIPASFCGVVGLKPTFGRISRFGVIPLGHTLDHVGHFTHSVADAALILGALAGPDPRDDSSASEPAPAVDLPADSKLKGVRVGVPRAFFYERLAPEVEAAVGAALQLLGSLGAQIRDVQIPEMEDFTLVSRVILLAEASATHRHKLRTRRADIGPDVAALLDQGLFVLATDYLDAQRRRRQFIAHLARLFDQVDVMVTATTPITAPKIGQTTVDIAGHQEDTRLASTRLVRALNLAGVPALSLPCGFDSQGLPIGLQIFGRSFDEASVLKVGHAYEQNSQWRNRRPEVKAV